MAGPVWKVKVSFMEGGTCLQEGQEEGVEATVHPDGRNLSRLLHVTAEERREVRYLLAGLPSALSVDMLTCQPSSQLAFPKNSHNSV